MAQNFRCIAGKMLQCIEKRLSRFSYDRAIQFILIISVVRTAKFVILVYAHCRQHEIPRKVIGPSARFLALRLERLQWHERVVIETAQMKCQAFRRHPMDATKVVEQEISTPLALKTFLRICKQYFFLLNLHIYIIQYYLILSN